MNTTMTWTVTPSQLLPIYSRAFGMSVCAQVDSRMFDPSIGSAAETTAVRTRVAELSTGRNEGAFPGTSVWRPPIC